MKSKVFKWYNKVLKIQIKFLFIVLFFSGNASGYHLNPASKIHVIYIEWSDVKPSGFIEVLNGKFKNMQILSGNGKIRGNQFVFSSSGRTRIRIDIEDANIEVGPLSTIVSVNTAQSPFSFFLRDVTTGFPIYIPNYSVVVLEEKDFRSYGEVKANIKAKNLKTELQNINEEDEESFASASSRTLNQTVPTWLGISRDFRIFQIDESLSSTQTQQNVITPKFASSPLILPIDETRAASYAYTIGRGVGVEIQATRWLEQGILPILHNRRIDGEIEYHSTSFVSLGYIPLKPENIEGTHFLVADKNSRGHMLTDAQENIVKKEQTQSFNFESQTVFYFQCIVRNNGKVPRYAWLKTIKNVQQKTPYTFDPLTGFSYYKNDAIYVVSKLNNKPLPNEEMAILLQPGETARFEFILPHAPVTREKAHKLFKQSLDDKLAECKFFWQSKLTEAAQVRIPEKRIQEMFQAGLLHLDIITYGKEPNGTLAPTIGVYAPIGTESAPIIQFYNSMGWHSVAKRSLNYFLDKQHDNGFMQNFSGYMVETGAVLWSLGEYYRYTNDKSWLASIESKIIKASDFLINWRRKSMKDSLKGKGFGMIAGKVADPEHHFHQFMLNGYAYLGLSRVAEMLKEINPRESERLAKEAEAWKNDILESFNYALARGPAVPLGDGTWSPTVPPWPEAIGPKSLFVQQGIFFSHGTLTVPDVLLGPLHLVFCEVLDVNDPKSFLLLNYQSELYFQRNAAFSQPYYSRHNWVQAKLGMVKPFLKTYYNTFSALADRETYTFWEHLFHASPHKTHEEAWFLMETRWMLYLEEGKNLALLKTIPRKWLEHKNEIELRNVNSYFGPLNIMVKSFVNEGYIEANIQCTSERKPDQITIRLPHPKNIKPIEVVGGDYDFITETVTVKVFNGEAFIKVIYPSTIGKN
jgi:hypothetical protein